MTTEYEKHNHQTRWMRDYHIARGILYEEGGEFSWRYHQHEAFQYENDNVCLLFYPHKGCSSGILSIMARNHGSHNKLEALRLLRLLDENGIHCKTSPETHLKET